LTPVRDRYEPGDLATLAGYTGGPQLLANRPPGPYRAFLEDGEGRLRIPVGELALTDTGRKGFEALRVVARFVVPTDLPPGGYRLSYCTDTCQLPLLGDVTGGSLSVGVDPPVPWSHLWPLDEPEIANLSNHAILTGPGYQTTAGEVWAGRMPPSQAVLPVPPRPLPCPSLPSRRLPQSRPRNRSARPSRLRR
jgi:hypothetical protein